MSRVRGPTSALTEFLRERGINHASLARFRRNAERQDAATQSALDAIHAGDVDTADAALAAVMQADERASAAHGERSSSAARTPRAAASASPSRSANRPASARRRSRNSIAYAEEDGTDEEEAVEQEEVLASAAASRTRASTSSSRSNGKRTATAVQAEAEASASKNKKHKKKPGGHDDDDDDADFLDGANGPVAGSSRSNHSYAGRTPGKIDYCAGCKRKFTITVYTKVTDQGAYCHICKSPNDAAAAPAPKPKKKRITAAEKRQQAIEDLKTKIPSLQSMCISIVSDHIEDVEALGDIGPHNVEAISKAIARSRSLNPNTVKLFLMPGSSELALYDCSQLDGDALASFATFAPDLEAINLQMCGRLVDSALDAWGTKLKKLRSLELFGPYLVRVEAWHRFFDNVGPRLRSFKIRETPRFDLSCVEKMVEACPNLTELGLAQIGKLDGRMLGPLAAYSHLTYLDISDPGVSGPGIMAESLKDESVIQLLSQVGATLQTLHLSGNTALTDEVVTKGIAPYCKSLFNLACSGCEAITGAAFVQLWKEGSTSSSGEATHANGSQRKRGRPSKTSQPDSSGSGSGTTQLNGGVPKSAPLKRIDLSRALLVDDAALEALMHHSGPSLEHINLNSVDLLTERGLAALARHARNVVTLDLSFCRAVDDSLLVDLMTIPTLERVLVWGCNRVSDLISHPRVAIVGKERSVLF